MRLIHVILAIILLSTAVFAASHDSTSDSSEDSSVGSQNYMIYRQTQIMPSDSQLMLYSKSYHAKSYSDTDYQNWKKSKIAYHKGWGKSKGMYDKSYDRSSCPLSQYKQGYRSKRGCKGKWIVKTIVMLYLFLLALGILLLVWLKVCKLNRELYPRGSKKFKFRKRR